MKQVAPSHSRILQIIGGSVALLLLPLALVFAAGRWTPDSGVVVRSPQAVEFAAATANQVADAVYVVWSSYQVSSWDLYAQRLAPDGTAQWDSTGVPVATSPGHEIEAKAVPCGDGFIAAWHDPLAPDGNNTPRSLRLSRLDSTGQPLWFDMPHGSTPAIPLYDHDGLRVQGYRLCPDSNDGVYVVAEVKPPGSNDYRLRVHHLTSSGTLAPHFPETGLHIADYSGNEARADELLGVACDGAGGLFLLWKSVPFPGNWKRERIAHVSQLGQQSWTRIYDIDTWTSDGHGALFVGWDETDGRNNGQSWDQSWIVSITRDGEHEWEIPLSDMRPKGSQDIVLLPAGFGSAWVLWWGRSHERNYAYQRLFHSLHGEFSWDMPGPEFDHDQGNIHLPKVKTAVPDGSGGSLALFGPNWPPFHLQHFRSDGTTAFPGFDGVVHSTTTIVSLGETAYFIDHSGDVPQQSLHVRRFDNATSNFLDDAPGIEVISGVAAAARPYSAQAVPGQGVMWIGWCDERYATPYEIRLHLFVQQLDLLTGIPLLADQGLSLFPDLPFTPDLLRTTTHPQDWRMHTNQDDELFVALEIGVDGNYDDEHLRIQKVSPAGELLWGSSGAAPNMDSPPPLSLEFPWAIPDDNGGAFVFVTTEGTLNSTLMTHLDQDGQPLLTDGDRDFANLEISLDIMGLSYFATESELVVFHRHPGGLFASRFSQDAELLWTTFLGPEMQNPNATRAWALRTSGDVIALWEDPSDIVLAQRIHPDGTVAWDEGGKPLFNNQPGMSLWYPPSIEEDGDSFWVTAEGGGVPQGFQRFDLNGEPASAQFTVPSDDLGFSVAMNDGSLYVMQRHGYTNQHHATLVHVPASGLLDPDDDSFVVACSSEVEVAWPRLARDGQGGVVAYWNDMATDQVPSLDFNELKAQRFAFPVTGVDEADRHAAQPGEFRLDPVSPNPFNHRATVTLHLPQADKVTVAVFNVLGQEVARPVASTRLTAGPHRIGIDLAKHAGGIYFVRVSAAGQTPLVRKLVLLP